MREQMISQLGWKTYRGENKCDTSERERAVCLVIENSVVSGILVVHTVDDVLDDVTFIEAFAPSRILKWDRCERELSWE